jgi:polygalacturonase
MLASLISVSAARFNVMDYGAVADGKILTTEAIQCTIDTCAKAGGGTVFLPTGTYLVGTINLYSNIEFLMEHGAILKATTDLTAYQRHNEQLAGVFYTDGADNVVIKGGTIDGQGLSFMDTTQSKRVGTYEKQHTRQGMEFRNAPNAPDDGPYEPLERFHQMIVFTECTNLRLENFKCINSPFWCFLIVHSHDIRIKGVDIFNDLMIPNSDGIDLISSSNATISDCHIYAGDDAIVVAGYGWHQGDPGFKNLNTPSRNINVTNCILQSRSSGIRIGGHDQNEMSDYNFSDITILNSNRGINISVSDSCSLENVSFNNIHIETRLHTGDWWGQGEPINITAMQLLDEKPVIGKIRKLYFNNITSVGENSVVIIADPQTSIEDVYFSNFEFILRRSAIEDQAGGNYDLRLNVHPNRSLYATDEPVFYIENARNIYFTRGTIGWKNADKPYHTYAIEAINVNNMVIDNIIATASPSHPDYEAIRTNDCTGVKLNLVEN